MNISHVIKNVIGWSLAALLCVVIFYLVIDLGSAPEVFKAYGTLGGNITSNFNKTVTFLSSYIKNTGDLTIAEAAGLSEEEIKELIEPSVGTEESESTGTAGIVGSTPVSWTSSTLQDSINKWKQSHTVQNMIMDTDGGITYPREQQVTYWTGNGGKGGGCHGLGAGCLWFSSAVAASMVSGNVVGVSDLLAARGYKVKLKDGSAYIEPGMEYVGTNSSGCYPDGNACMPGGVLSGFATVKVSSNFYDQNFINNGGVYLVHANGDTSALLSSGDQHWFVIAGKDSQGRYIVLNGCGSQGSKGYMDPNLRGLLNCIYEVTK